MTLFVLKILWFWKPSLSHPEVYRCEAIAFSLTDDGKLGAATAATGQMRQLVNSGLSQLSDLTAEKWDVEL